MRINSNSESIWDLRKIRIEEIMDSLKYEELRVQEQFSETIILYLEF
jgi:hypothetical protein